VRTAHLVHVEDFDFHAAILLTAVRRLVVRHWL